MDPFKLYCEISFGTTFDPTQPRRRKNKLKNHKINKRKRIEENEDNETIPNNTADNIIKMQLSDSSDDSEFEIEIESKIESQNQGNVQSKKKKEKKILSAMQLLKLRQEEVVHFRRKNKIYAIGSDVPDPMENFQLLATEFEAQEILLQNIDKLGYSAPTKIQMQAIPLMLHNRQILACAPTGSGKTAAFLIPLIHNLKESTESGIRALIIAPTRELVNQIYSFCIKLTEGINIKALIIANANTIIEDPNKLKGFDILITTPNRLIYLLKEDPPVINLKSVEWLVIDECDKLFEVGKQGFRDQLGVIYKACESAKVKRALFSATFSHDVEEWCNFNIDSLVSVSIGTRNTAVESVKQELLFVGSEGGKLIALRNLIKGGFMPPVLIFVQSKERAQDLYSEFVYDNVRLDVIHADLSQPDRDIVVQNFIAGKVWILICTELMARGIDFKGVNMVINYDFPTTPISYIHRIGRTGRAGETGRAVTYFTTDDVDNLRSIAQVIKTAGCEVPDYIMALKKAPRRNKSEPVRPIKRESISSAPKDQPQKKGKRKQFIRKSFGKIRYKKKLLKTKTETNIQNETKSVKKETNIQSEIKSVKKKRKNQNETKSVKKKRKIQNEMKSVKKERKKVVP